MVAPIPGVLKDRDLTSEVVFDSPVLVNRIRTHARLHVQIDLSSEQTSHPILSYGEGKETIERWEEVGVGRCGWVILAGLFRVGGL